MTSRTNSQSSGATYLPKGEGRVLAPWMSRNYTASNPHLFTRDRQHQLPARPFRSAS